MVRRRPWRIGRILRGFLLQRVRLVARYRLPCSRRSDYYFPWTTRPVSLSLSSPEGRVVRHTCNGLAEWRAPQDPTTTPGTGEPALPKQQRRRRRWRRLTAALLDLVLADSIPSIGHGAPPLFGVAPCLRRYPLEMAVREVKLVQTARPFEYVSPYSGEEHTLLVCVADATVTSAERASVSAEIVAAKCRYAVCWGYDCSSWDTAIDCACIQTDENFSPPDETFVMTTWHDESVEDAIDFWWMNTCFDDYESTKFAALIIGEDIDLLTKVQAITSELARHWNGQEPDSKAG